MVTSLIGSNLNIDYGITYYSVKLVDKDNDILFNKTVKTQIIKDNKEIKTCYSNTYEDGMIKILINLNPGKYIFKNSFTEDGYKNSYLENVVTVNKVNTYLNSNNLLLNRKGEKFEVTLKDKKTSRPISNQKIDIIACGVKYTKITNEKGVAGLNINLREGKYLLNYEFKGTEGYSGAKGSKIVEVKNIKLNTILTPLNLNIPRKGNEYKVLLKDSNGIPLKGENVFIKVYGVTYKKCTDNEGVAKLKINGLNDNIYDITCYYPGSELFNGKTINNKLNVNTKTDFSYSFTMETKKLIKNKETGVVVPFGRVIEVSINNKDYLFYYDVEVNGGTKILDNKIYFIPFFNPNNQIQILNNENQLAKQGVSIKLGKSNILIKYHGKLPSSVSQFNTVYSQYKLYGFNGEKVNFILNNKIEASIKYTDKLLTNKAQNAINSINGFYFATNENCNTSFNTKISKIDRVIQVSYGIPILKKWKPNSYETIQSYVISSSKVSNNTISNAIEKGFLINEKYESSIYDTCLLSLITTWISDELSDELGKACNVNWWKNEVVVLTTKEWHGLSIDSKISIKESGTNENVRWFKLNHGLLFSLSEKLALEMSGQEAKCAVTEIMSGILNGKPFSIEQKEELIKIKLINSTDEIVINKTSGSTSAINGLNINKILKSINLKGGDTYMLLIMIILMFQNRVF